MTATTEKTSSQLPRVSIIIPTYNRSSMLPGAVESALAQTYPNIEVIVVDDGSTDNTADVIARYGDLVTYLKQANQDVAAARNTGIRATSGEYLTFLDDDDLIMPTKIERQVQVLTSQPRVHLVHCQFYYADEDGNYLSRVGLLPEGEVLQKLVLRNFVWVGAPLVHRQCLERIGIFDEEIPAICADWDLWLRVARAGYQFGCVQEPLGVYRVHGSNMMSDIARLERGLFAVLEKVFSDSYLPANVAASQQEAYGKICFWISCRYYDMGQWDAARRSLTMALDLHPKLSKRPEELAKLVCYHALSHRVTDPLRFVLGLLGHLPARADDLRRRQSHIISQVYVGLALRNFSAGDIAQARSQLTQATAKGARSEQANAFAQLLVHYAKHLPVSDPIPYVERVFGDLPVQAKWLRRVRARVLNDLNIELAYQAHSAGYRGLALRRILTALCYWPVSIRRRRTISIFLRSLPGLFIRKRRAS